MVVKQGQRAAGTHFRTRSFPGWLGHKPIPSHPHALCTWQGGRPINVDQIQQLHCKEQMALCVSQQWPRSTGRGTQGLGWGQGDDQGWTLILEGFSSPGCW